LSNGQNILACKPPLDVDQSSNRKVLLTSEDENIFDEIQISGESIMSGSMSNSLLTAIETSQAVILTENQALSEIWHLTVQ
jgi:hypothetical protein